MAEERVEEEMAVARGAVAMVADTAAVEKVEAERDASEARASQ